MTATAGDGSAVVSWTAPADGGSAITGYTVTPSSARPRNRADRHGHPAGHQHHGHRPDQRHRLHVQGHCDQRRRHRPASAASGPVTPAAGGCAVCTIWPPSATPAKPSTTETARVEVGVKFTADVNGQVTGIRFYKGTGNTGTHVGNLWTLSGTRLATVTFTDETATGWQQALFSTPVPVTAGTVYVASYLVPNGRYAGNSGYFNADRCGQPAPARPEERSERRQRRLRLRDDEHVPDQLVQGCQLLGRRGLRQELVASCRLPAARTRRRGEEG